MSPWDYTAVDRQGDKYNRLCTEKAHLFNSAMATRMWRISGGSLTNLLCVNVMVRLPVASFTAGSDVTLSRSVTRQGLLQCRWSLCVRQCTGTVHAGGGGGGEGGNTTLYLPRMAKISVGPYILEISKMKKLQIISHLSPSIKCLAALNRIQPA